MNLFFTVTARAEDWPSFLGPNRNGLSKESEWNPNFPKEGPEILWRAQVGTGFAAVTVAHGPHGQAVTPQRLANRMQFGPGPEGRCAGCWGSVNQTLQVIQRN